MKLLLLLFLPVFTFAQKLPKKTNTITVKNISFQEAATALLDAGYTIKQSDKELQIITTDEKKMCKNCVKYTQINVRIKDSVAVINGYWISTIFAKNGLTDADRYPIEAGTIGVVKETWKLMNDYALSFNKNVEYSIDAKHQ